LADLDFPVSPVDGQTYKTYTYVQSKNVWQSIPGLPAGVPAGTIMGWGGTTAPEQWVICDGTAVSRSTYSALYAAIGTTYGIGDGATTFNLPDLRGRVPVGSSSATSLGTATITIAAPGVVTTAAHGLSTGQIVYFTTTGALPTGLTANTGRYWVIVTSATTFTLASSLANATAGTAITTTGSTTGTHTAFLYDFELGQSNGKVSHALNINEMPSHNHNFTYAGGENATYPYTGSPNTSGGIAFSVGTSVFGAVGISSKGGNLPHLNVQPYETINYIIKYTAAYVPQESELSPRVTNLESGVTNRILNGSFDIWQRGTSFTSPANSSYVADRWATNVPAVSTISRQSASLTGFQYCMRVQRNSGQTTTAPFYVGQPFAIEEAIQLAGKTATISFYARAGANFSSSGNALSVTVSTGTGASDANRMAVTYTGDVAALNTPVTLTTSWQIFSLTFTFGSTITQFMPYFSFTPSGTAGANDYFEVTGVQLQTGSTASSFRRNAPSIQAELAACQRYYQLNTSWYQPTGATAFSNGARTLVVNFPVPMRATPTSFAQNPLGGGSVFTQNGINKDGWLGYTTAGGEMYMNGYAASAEL
jgi:microcystin-dependent protein